MQRLTKPPAVKDPFLGVDIFAEIATRISDAIGGVISSIVQAVTGSPGNALSLAGILNGHKTELADLQDKTQALEGVIGYAHAYVDGSISTTAGEKKLAMTNQIGPKAGVVPANGSFYLSSKGLWVADAHCTFDYLNVGVTALALFIRVYTPGGTLYAQRWAVLDSDDETTLAVHMPFTVPTSGYYVEMWANAAFGRGIFGGSANNGLSVNKVSTETS
ncbi:hypothetical protein [Rhodococcus opacus]|uniref:hypothetical protein n=1 Tax=Rhodococcus opacus TaxID=37919 RepID=UPI001C45C69E|nr:hypothetical protein [Rhodococcus opacus]MBV6758345.1 hypothetical protein [Rhodococcus opacus]